MLLGAQEKVVRSAYAVLETGVGDRSRRRPGVLYLTTDRLVFEGPDSRGLVRDLVAGRDVAILVDDPLGGIRNVTVRRGRIARPRLVVDRGGQRAVFDVLEPEAWTVAIADARRAAETARAAGRPPSGASARAVVKVRCRYCGGLGDEEADRCPSCGAPF
jgi:hypothetical protein